MSAANGRFVWYELMTTDLDAAERFYGAVVGWTATDAGMTDFRYTLLSAGETQVGGMMGVLPHLEGVPPHWTGYIGVDDVDAYAARVVEKGGAVHRQPEDIPQVGRFAVVTDPDGATFILFTPLRSDAPPTVPCGTQGHVGWHELRALNPERAFQFYADLFGWTKAEAIDMGLMGTYQIFAIDGVAVGGIMQKPDFVPVPGWLFYINVDATEAAMQRVRQARGVVVHGPQEVPGGSWVAVCRDPQSAVFAVVGPAR